jgi:hypothetical protein
VEAEAAALEPPPEKRHPPLRQRPLEHGARQPVDLDHEEPARARRRRPADASAPDEPIEPPLDPERDIVERHSRVHCTHRPRGGQEKAGRPVEIGLRPG